MENKYRGLSNIGATCYMNSLLQTLFMTPQFREIIYNWKYDKKYHPRQADSILYQLQKLFGKLQNNYPGQISTRDLAKSFQWMDQQAHIQQDIQQFNRVLFQALQKSFSKKNEENNSILKYYYQGQLIHYTKCNVCGYQSIRQQPFQDLILTIKNIYQKVYNSSIQLALQRYMKPQKLDNNNLYDCSKCLIKVTAERGVKFIKLPKLLNIILQRFNFDYFTMQRQKINDFIEFPFILNFNNYMNGYQGINNKINQDTSHYFKQVNIPVKKTVSSIKKTTIKKNNNQPNIAGKLKTKPLAQTKSFLKQMRMKKNYVDQRNDDLIFVSGSHSINIQKEKQVQPIIQQKNQQQLKNNQNQNPNQQQTIKSNEIPKLLQGMPPLPPPLTLPPPNLSQPYKNKVQTMQQQLQKYVKQKQTLDKQKQQKLQQYRIKNQQLINKYLLDGPLVYQLYSVMIHNGSATHGHYYSYIKSFQDQKWYCFNDQRVSQINITEISKAFGSNGTTSNAYALYYRKVNTKQQQQQYKKVQIPQYIKQVIKQQIDIYKKRQTDKLLNLQNIIILKIHYQLYVKQLQINKTQTLKYCLEKVKELFNIGNTIQQHNIRLRMFNPSSQTKLDTYTGRQLCTLQQLKIYSYKSLLLEVKKTQEIFDQFQHGFITIRIVLWEQSQNNITSLQQTNLKLHKVSVNRYSIIKQVQQCIKQKRNQILNNKQQKNICIIKRHQNDQYSYHQIVNIQQFSQKTLDDLMINQNQILYIQINSQNLKWPKQFENQIYRINIKYNLPGQTQIFNYQTDSRITLQQLKIKICYIIGQSIDDVIIKRGNKSGMQLKNIALTLKQHRFINGTQLYLEKGIPAKPGEIRIQLYFAHDAQKQLINRLHQFQFIGDIPINGSYKASQVKDIFIKIISKYKNINLIQNQFRIRQKVSDKIGKIYREKPMKQQQLIQKRQIAIQFKQDNIDSKDYSIYVRYWDQNTWELSQKYQFMVNKNTTMIQFAIMIQQIFNNVQVQKMGICRVLSIHKFSMLDLVELQYFPMTEASVTTQPLFVNSDGLLFIIKDMQKEPRALTRQQQIKFGGTLRIIQRGPQKRSSTKVQRGVVIKVIQKQQIDQEITEKKQ